MQKYLELVVSLWYTHSAMEALFLQFEILRVLKGFNKIGKIKSMKRLFESARLAAVV
jgi:hypothetical protein